MPLRLVTYVSGWSARRRTKDTAWRLRRQPRAELDGLFKTVTSLTERIVSANLLGASSDGTWLLISSFPGIEQQSLDNYWYQRVPTIELAEKGVSRP